MKVTTNATKKHLKHIKNFTSALLVTTSFLACTKKSEKIDVVENKPVLSSSNPVIQGVVADSSTPTVAKAIELSPTDKLLQSQMKKMVSTKSDQFSNVENYAIKVKKDALSDKFLLSLAILDGFPNPNGRFAESKVVSFEKRGNKLILLEDTTFKVNSDSNQTKIIVADFEIIKIENEGTETENYIIDFSKGTSQLINPRGYYSDYPEEEEGERLVEKVTNSFIDSVKFKGDALVIDQYIRVSSNKMIDILNSAEVSSMKRLKWVLRSFRINENFKVKESTRLDSVGYFENVPLIMPGTTQEILPVKKFDENKNITYYLSKDIPEDYRQAVKDGVLYWNKAIGREMISVLDQTDDMEVHDPNINMIKWINWDTAGSAYATFQSNPVTGEILETDVYFTSTFAKGGLKSAKKLLRQLINDSKKDLTITSAKTQTKSNTNSKIELKGFKNQDLCNYKQENSLTNRMVLQNLIAQAEIQAEKSGGSAEDIFKRISQDYIREVVAHEVGHTLGLRHNFMGSTQINADITNYDDIFNYYLATGKNVNKFSPGSSVMDYTIFSNAAMIGAHIRNHPESLKYDKAAILWGYSDTDMRKLNFGPFCTDGKADDKFIDCLRFDVLATPMSNLQYSKNTSIKNIAYKVADIFSFLRIPTLKDANQRAILIRDAGLNPSADIKVISDTVIPGIIKMASEDTFLLSLISVLDISEDNYQDALDSISMLKEKDIKRFGGTSALIFDEITPNVVKDESGNLISAKTVIASKVEEQALKIIKNEMLDKGLINANEMELIKVKINNYLRLMDQNIIAKAVSSLKEAKLSIKDDLLASKLRDLAKVVILTDSNETLISADGITIKKPYFSESKLIGDIRKDTAEALAHNLTDFLLFAKKEKTEIRKAIDDKLSAIEEANKGKDNEQVIDFIKKEKKRFNSLD